MTFYVGGDTRLPSLAFCSRYNRDAHYADIADSVGVAHWVTQKQMRIHGILARVSMSVDGRTKMADVAREAQCCTSTVSRTILKLQGWGLFAVDVRRGRNGGITVLRATGSWMASYVRAARQKIRDLKIRAQIKLASMIQGREEGGMTATGLPDTYRLDMDASFSRRPGLTAENVVYERAMLALTDPDGEYESRHPLTREEAIAMLDWRGPRED
jgi:hypothetical protein